MSELKKIQENLDKAKKCFLEGNLEKAEYLYRNILSEHINHPDALHYLGLTLSARGRNDLAVKFISRSVQIDPLNYSAFYNLGLIFQSRKNSDGAVACFKIVLQLNPDFYDANFQLANLLIDLGLAEESVPFLKRIITLNPEAAEAYYNLAIFYQERKNLTEAENNFRKAVSLKNDWAVAHNNLGNVLYESGNLTEALKCYFTALKYTPDWASVYNNIGSLYMELGKNREAMTYFQKIIDFAPEDYGKRYTILLSLQFESDLSQEIWKQKLNDFASIFSKFPKYNDYKVLLSKTKKLRIGYVSPDFCKHSCGWFIMPLLMYHDHQKYEIYCFSLTRSEDSITERIKNLTDYWFDINSLSDHEIVELIRKNKIDILVDLAGHTANNRLSVFAYKPAPVQVTWLGSPGSTGLDTIDYRLSDLFLTPVGTQEYFSEKLWNLERLSHSYKPPDESPPVGPLPFLKNGFLTFGSFNSAAKITNETFEIWSEVLKNIPDSRIKIKVRHGNNPGLKERFLRILNKNGIESGRIDIYPAQHSTRDHLEYYNQIDIALDTFPYNGATTTLEALWMGVPVVSLYGNRMVSRFGLSFLSTLNLKHLAAANKEDYTKIVLKLSEDIGYLTNLRTNLRKMVMDSQIYDWQGFANAVEDAYWKMWELCCISEENK